MHIFATQWHRTNQCRFNAHQKWENMMQDVKSDAKAAESIARCMESLDGWTKEQLIAMLIESGCADDTPALRNSRTLFGLQTELCGCRCSGFFPFANNGDGEGSLPVLKHELKPPIASGAKNQGNLTSDEDAD